MNPQKFFVSMAEVVVVAPTEPKKEVHDPWKGFGGFLKGMPTKKQPKIKKKQLKVLMIEIILGSTLVAIGINALWFGGMWLFEIGLFSKLHREIL